MSDVITKEALQDRINSTFDAYIEGSRGEGKTGKDIAYVETLMYVQWALVSLLSDFGLDVPGFMIRFSEELDRCKKEKSEAEQGTPETV